MKTKTIQFTLTTLITLSLGTIFAQNQVQYDYDDAGNRIKRESGTTQFIQTDGLVKTHGRASLSGVDLNAHPNPTSQSTEITLIIDPETISEADQIAIASGVTMQLADVTGKIIKTQHVGAYGNTTFDMQNIAQGVYFVKVFTVDGRMIGERKILRE